MFSHVRMWYPRFGFPFGQWLASHFVGPPHDRYITSELGPLLGAGRVTLDHVRWAYLVRASQRDPAWAVWIPPTYHDIMITYIYIYIHTYMLLITHVIIHTHTHIYIYIEHMIYTCYFWEIFWVYNWAQISTWWLHCFFLMNSVCPKMHSTSHESWLWTYGYLFGFPNYTTYYSYWWLRNQWWTNWQYRPID